MDAAAALLLLVMLWLYRAGDLGIVALLVLQAATSIVDTFYGNASASIVPSMFGKEKLAQIQSKRAVVDNIAHIAGPILGGFLYAFGGLSLAFIVNLISFSISFICEVGLKYEWKITKTPMGEPKIHLLKAYAPILSFVNKTGVVRRMFFLVSVMNLLAVPLEIIAIPFFFKQTAGLSDHEFGFIQSAMLVGALLGNMLIPWLISKGRDYSVFNSSIILQHIFTLVLSVVSLPTFYLLYKTYSGSFLILSLALLVIIGLFNGIANTMLMAALQTKIPDEMMGKFVGLLQLVLNVLNPIGVLCMGWALDVFPAHIPMMTTAFVLMAIVMWFVQVDRGSVFEPQSAPE